MGGKHKRTDNGSTFIKNASHFNLPTDLKPALAESQPFNSPVSNVFSSSFFIFVWILFFKWIYMHWMLGVALIMYKWFQATSEQIMTLLALALANDDDIGTGTGTSKWWWYWVAGSGRQVKDIHSLMSWDERRRSQAGDPLTDMENISDFKKVYFFWTGWLN